MSVQAATPQLAADRRPSVCAPEQSLPVAALLSMSGGFLDAFTWLSLGGVFANSQTGNFVLLGMYAALGKWQDAAHHIPPIMAFLAGASVAVRVRAPLLCLSLEIALLATVALLLHELPEPLVIAGISFGAALQTASFRNVERWKYLSVTVTGNMLRGVEQLVSTDAEASRGARIMLVICLMFLLGAAAGGFAATRLGASSLVAPIGLLVSALWLCCRNRYRRDLG
jgi:uncharacterized membrane protein YoaK (UPF0700 family)